MATQKQIDANRRNSRLSTGPRTESGKRASSQNALTSGLDAESQFVLGESREEFAQLQAEYFARFAPATPEPRFHVDNLIRNEWVLRRYHRVESHLWEYQSMLCDRSSGVQLGEAFSKASTVFMRLQRRINAAEKSYREAMAELTRLREGAQTTGTEGEITQLASFLNSHSDGLADFALAQMEQAFSRVRPTSDAGCCTPPAAGTP